METIFITGHKNPDMDSVCASHCYSIYKNRIDPENRYVPVRCGHLNEQAKNIFESLEIEPPVLIKDIFPRVKDILRKDPATISENTPVFSVIKLLDQLTVSVLPVFNGDKYSGLVSINEISRFFISENLGNRPIYRFRTPNFQEVLPGYFFQKGDSEEFTAPIMTGAMPYEVSVQRINQLLPEKPILIIGMRNRILAHAVKEQFPAIVLTGVSSAEQLDFDFSSFRGTIFVSEKDTAETIRLLRLSTPVVSILPKGYPELSGEDLFEDAKKLLVESEYRGLPVFDNGNFMGVVTRRRFIEKPKRKIIMVDHNEISQSVPGIETGEIIEIIDHHRLGAERTRYPIYVASKPVGSTCTIIYQHFVQSGIPVDKKTALLMLGGILSDTIVLKSPTTTQEDRVAAMELAGIGGVECIKYGEEIFSRTPDITQRDPGKTVASDFKIYTEYGRRVGIGQAEVVSLENVGEVKEEFVDALVQIGKEQRLDWVMILITNVIREESILLSTSFPEAEKLLIYKKTDEGEFFLPGILSRKKQLLPEIFRVLEELGRN